MQIAIVTGAAQGIGLAVAWEMARRGLTAVLADINLAPAAERAAELSAAGFKAEPIQVDVACRSSVDRMVQDVAARHGRIDVLVNNAGIAGRAAPLGETPEEEWDRVI